MIKNILAYALIKKGNRPPDNIAGLESRQSNNESHDFNDSFYFTGHNKEGAGIITRLAFRNSGVTETWLDVKLPSMKILTLPRHTWTPGSDISCGPLRYRCLEPCKEWGIFYDGPMLQSGKTVQVNIKAIFTSQTPMIDFKKHTDSWSIAKHLARKKWTIPWLRKLKDLGQMHFEQGGLIQGKILLNGTEHDLELRALRDHSFGSRNWKAMKRHLWIAALMNNGTYINISMVQYSFLDFLHSGYCADKTTIVPVVETGNFDSIPPGTLKGYSFDLPLRFKRKGWEVLSCSVRESILYPMGKSYSVHEGIADFSLGNIKGTGICEHGIDTSPDR